MQGVRIRGFIDAIALFVRMDFEHISTPHSNLIGHQLERICIANKQNVGHKLGQFHLRPKAPTEDFYLLSPLDPFKELGDYQCHSKELHFFFCKTCGVTPFLFVGEGEISELSQSQLSELGISQGKEEAQGSSKEVVKAWRPIGEKQYCSINGHTIDAQQPGFDMREMKEQKVIQYIDYLNYPEPREEDSHERPCTGGCY